MKQNSMKNQDAYNQAVTHAHTHILKKSLQLLASIERDDLRVYFERKIVQHPSNGILHEIVSPLIYLRLQCELDGAFAIHFGIEPIPKHQDLSDLTSEFMRVLFRLTDRTTNAIDIEHCIHTDWFINVCSEVYEYIEMDPKYHRMKIVAYKALSSKRKRLRVA